MKYKKLKNENIKMDTQITQKRRGASHHLRYNTDIAMQSSRKKMKQKPQNRKKLLE